ncbi:YggS family pyridoxal phosphate-dependent enzyme [Alkaliphilus pronyensis]|uniref:Pyridoxal phosphate homeostasis protein n=1 Tax=Alkaliphilus pronyensis TaxID=1482732 RepID=A0A6I0F058_9FIRM|nr:YggS family pyridoxal phosphate-dependent enzyme [Alkaliphilus pronyensis]
MSIGLNIEKINKAIESSASNFSRNVTLVAVTKTVSVDKIKEAIDLGVTDVGENRVQELVKKYELIGNKVKWHLIGHLQRNKVKYIVDKVDLIHSLDSYELALEIEKRASKIKREISCLVEVNISGEESKYGLNPSEVKPLLEKLDTLSFVKVEGLMTMAPYVENPEEVRKYFRALRQLSEDIKQLAFNNVSMKYLSMGMSNDYEVALEEGANIVRVGSAIFS